MKLLSLHSLAVALLLIGVSGMVVPTAAIPTEDRPWEDDPAIALAPSSGPNGAFATIDADGNLSVAVSDVNTGAVTLVGDVFTITNNEDTRYAVWVSHDAGDTVEVQVDGDSIEDENDPLLLPSGEQRGVGLEIDSRGLGPDEQLMSELTLHAMLAPPSAGGSTPTTSPTATPEPAVEEVIEIEFGLRTASPADPSSYSVREIDLTDLDEDPEATPRAAIRHADDGPVVMGLEASRVRAGTADAVTMVGDPIYLSGSRSVFGQVAGIDPDRRLAKLVTIDVPPEHRDRPSRLRFTVARSTIGGTEPGDLVVGRKTDGGWQLLDTTVVDASDRTVTVEAVTPGFSTFAVFTRTAVRYEWSLPEGRTVSGKALTTTFDEPGRYTVSLTVTDAFGRSDTGQYRIVANDVPRVDIDGLESAGEPGRATLRANVTDEVGNVTVTWVFADGSTIVGETVTREFEDGETVRVVVEDEYGAKTRVEGTVGRPFSGEERSVFRPVRFTLGLQSQVAFLGLAIVLLVLALRRVGARRYGLP